MFKFIRVSSFVGIISAIYGFQAHAEDLSLDRPHFDSNKAFKINYHVPSWNKNPNEADVAAVLFRDANTGKLARIELRETGPNTNEFVGQYSISFGEKEVTPEIYFVPQEMLKDQNRMKALEDMIKEETLQRKPLFVRAEKNALLMTVFDTKDQALDAFSNFRKNIAGKPVVSQAALDAARKAALLAEQKRLAEIARIQELERIRLADLERTKAEERKRQQEKLDKEERERRIKKAKDLAAQALQKFQQANFPEAESLFDKSIELDPSNNSYYFQYGATLYKNGKYNNAVVALSMAKGEGFDPIEKLYLMGASHMKLKEVDKAYQEFSDVEKSNHKALAPSGAFFAGLLDFQLERYDSAKLHFEYVLDHSSDKNLDEQADTYIEQIANIKMFEEQRKKKFLFTVNVGLNYDSNVTTASDSQLDSGAATNVASSRIMYGGSVEWRPIYGVNHEWSTVLSYNNMKSSNSSVTSADALVDSIALPYKYKTTLGGKGYQFGFTPSYEMMSLDYKSSGSQDVLLKSTVMKFDNMLVMRDDWFSNYSLELRSDANQADSLSGTDNDPGASKWTLATSQTFFKDKKKTQAVIYDLSYANNSAAVNTAYTRLDAGLSYMMPAIWNSSAVYKLSYYGADYNKTTSGRKDTDIGLTASLRKPFSDTLSLSGVANYTINNSSDSSYQYKKYTLTLMLTWTPSI